MKNVILANSWEISAVVGALELAIAEENEKREHCEKHGLIFDSTRLKNLNSVLAKVNA